MKYEGIFRRAWKNVMNSWIREKIDLRTEYDLQGYMFSACLELIRREKPDERAHAYLNRSGYYIEGGLRSIDLVLGEHWQVIAEFKFEKPTNRKVVMDDLKKLRTTFSTLVDKEECKTEHGFFGTIFQIRDKNTIETYRERLAPLLDRLGMSAEWKEMKEWAWVSVLVSVSS